MELLFVDACPRGEASRTRLLAGAFLRRAQTLLPELRVVTHDLAAIDLRPIDAQRLARKEALCDRRAWDDPSLSAGADFQRADAVVIAAPYWDLSFPSVLKIWVEHIWVRNLTFVYRDDKPVGLARGKAAVYLTTAGSAVAGHDWGTGYMEDVLRTLGIPAFRAVLAERMDLDTSDPARILSGAMTEAESAAAWLAERLRENGADGQ